MLFNSFIFLFAFLPITYAVFWALRSAQQRYIWLTVTGYVFYGYWDPRYCLLMAFSTLVSYGAGLGLLRNSDPTVRRWYLIVPVVVDLSLLGYFKYADFGLQSAESALNIFGAEVDFPLLHIVLPIGISFYTFHTISYIVDSYRGVIQPTRNLFEFSAYVSLFSQLVAGPIVRFRQIEQDLAALGQADRNRWLAQGISFFTLGLIEKVVIADSLARFVDPALADYQSLSTAATWLAMLGYTFQLYFDFCGYSDMAIGLGLMFGLRIPLNFNSPYKALNPSDFWRRWHISLSTCMRDYLYIPLGGNRKGEWRTYINLTLTMLIGGLWHGASWTFVVWGGYHGLLLAAYKRFGSIWDRLPPLIAQILMFILVIVGWVFFRSTDMTMAGEVLRKMFVVTPGTPMQHMEQLLPLLVFAAWWAMAGPNGFDLQRTQEWRRAFAFPVAVAFGACLAIMANGADSPFLYFQF